MEINNILLIKSSSMYDIQQRPREVVDEISKVVSGLYYKLGKNKIQFGTRNWADVQLPRNDNEKSLYALINGKLIEFNPFLTDFEEKLTNANKEEFSKVFDLIETIYNKALEIKEANEPKSDWVDYPYTESFEPKYFRRIYENGKWSNLEEVNSAQLSVLISERNPIVEHTIHEPVSMGDVDLSAFKPLYAEPPVNPIEDSEKEKLQEMVNNIKEDDVFNTQLEYILKTHKNASIIENKEINEIEPPFMLGESEPVDVIDELSKPKLVKEKPPTKVEEKPKAKAGRPKKVLVNTSKVAQNKVLNSANPRAKKDNKK